MRKQISYIQDLGFDSIWLSPYSEQGPDAFGVAAYHGYWPSNFYKVNPAFGTEQELVELVRFYQQQGARNRLARTQWQQRQKQRQHCPWQQPAMEQAAALTLCCTCCARRHVCAV